jgi:hypothetical protein
MSSTSPAVPDLRRRIALLIVAVTTIGLGACTSSSPAPTPTSVPMPTPPIAVSPRPPVALHQTGPVRAPAGGVLVGAWVKPLGAMTQASRVQAVDDLQHDIGRKLDIVNTYRTFDQAFPTSSDYALTAGGATLMVSWATGDTRAITSGSVDPQIVAWAQRFKAFGHPIMLRMRWEMDRPNLRATMWSGADFVAAWKHVRAVFAAQHVQNVSWVWCPTSVGFANHSAAAFYPGDDEVDWTCVDVYSATKLQPLDALLSPFLDWAAAHPKPIIIGEFGVADAYGPTARAAWLQEAGAVFQSDGQIRAVCYFDSDPDGAIPQQSFALPEGSAPMDAFGAMARADYFNPEDHAVTVPAPGAMPHR